ncbi:hypothetical protein KI387_026200, partial [Taxus chinensis]
MYAKCGKIEKARDLFDKMPQQTGVSWIAMITRYMVNSKVDEALKIFQDFLEKITTSWNAMIVGYVQNGHCKEALLKIGEVGRITRIVLVAWLKTPNDDSVYPAVNEAIAPCFERVTGGNNEGIGKDALSN